MKNLLGIRNENTKETLARVKRLLSFNLFMLIRSTLYITALVVVLLVFAWQPTTFWGYLFSLLSAVIIFIGCKSIDTQQKKKFLKGKIVLKKVKHQMKKLYYRKRISEALMWIEILMLAIGLGSMMFHTGFIQCVKEIALSQETLVYYVRRSMYQFAFIGVPCILATYLLFLVRYLITGHFLHDSTRWLPHPSSNDIEEEVETSQSQIANPNTDSNYCYEESVKNFTDTRVFKKTPSKEWSIAGISSKGNVRERNEDHVCTFSVGEIDFAVVADGLGGLTKGKEAAHIAVNSAAQFLIKSYYQYTDSWYKSHEIMALVAIHQAYFALMEIAKDQKIQPNKGLRTTLIVTIATRDKYYYAYIGDGGIFCLRENGEHEQIMKPQKAHGASLNVLSASLGPIVEGKPIYGQFKRYKGDLLLVGTDGIFDRAKIAPLSRYIHNTSINNKGNLTKTCHQIINELAKQKNSANQYIFDDNLTLAIIGTKHKPQLPDSFWKKQA